MLATIGLLVGRRRALQHVVDHLVAVARVADADAAGARNPAPQCVIMSRSPLWPPWPPPNLSRAVPGGRSSSSCTTSTSATGAFV